MLLFDYVGTSVRFNQSLYNFNEGTGPAQPVLILSNSASFFIAVQVRDNQNTATSEWSNIITKC